MGIKSGKLSPFKNFQIFLQNTHILTTAYIFLIVSNIIRFRIISIINFNAQFFIH
jgi:hypothetical protein